MNIRSIVIGTALVAVTQTTQSSWSYKVTACKKNWEKVLHTWACSRFLTWVIMISRCVRMFRMFDIRLTVWHSIFLLYNISFDRQGSIPSEIGLLSHLTYLRLSYNMFVGVMPKLGSLTHPKLIQLYGNRISGEIPLLVLGTQLVEGQSYSD